MELKYYTTQELKEELKRRAELAREKRAEEMKNAVRCRNCKFFKPRTDVCNFYYCEVRTWGKHNRHYCVKPHTKGCDKFERKEIEI